MIIIFCFFVCRAEAQQHDVFMDSIPEICDNVPDKDYISICQEAKHFQVTPRYFIATSVLANSEFVAKKCNFKLIDNFNTIKNNILASENRKRIYTVAMQGKEVLEKTNSAWCKREYQAWKGYGLLK